MAELCSHQVNVANWFLGSSPDAVHRLGRPLSFPGGSGSLGSRLCHLRVPGGRTAVFSSIESNAFDDYYEMYMGTKGTLIMLREREALLFEEGGSGRQTGIEVTPAGTGAAAQSSETMAAHTNQGAPRAAASSTADDPAAGPSATRLQMRRFCSAIRVGTPLACGPDKAIGSARACIGANEAIKTKARVTLRTTQAERAPHLVEVTSSHGARPLGTAIPEAARRHHRLISRVIGKPERSGLSRIEKGTSARDVCFGHTDLDGSEAVDRETVRVP